MCSSQALLHYVYYNTISMTIYGDAINTMKLYGILLQLAGANWNLPYVVSLYLVLLSKSLLIILISVNYQLNNTETWTKWRK